MFAQLHDCLSRFKEGFFAQDAGSAAFDRVVQLGEELDAAVTAAIRLYEQAVNQELLDTRPAPPMGEFGKCIEWRRNSHVIIWYVTLQGGEPIASGGLDVPFRFRVNSIHRMPAEWVSTHDMFSMQVWFEQVGLSEIFFSILNLILVCLSGLVVLQRAAVARASGTSCAGRDA